MRRFFSNLIMLGFLAASASAAPTTPATKPAGPSTRPASMQEIKSSYDTGDYRAVIRDVARGLALKGKAADEYDRHDLLLLRGESLLRLKETPAAATAFEQAAKEAANEKDRNDALAMSVLLGRTGGRTL